MKNILTVIVSLLSIFSVYGQEFYDMGTIQTIKITFAESNWDALLDDQKSGAGDYLMAKTIEINGVLLDSVGVKYKGNSTYNANNKKNPFHIELNTYKDQNYGGYTDIKLSNVANDPSFVREVLSYQIARQYMDAPKSNYANVYVNGTLVGLFTNSEPINKVFLKDRFDSKNNTLVKCNPPGGAGPQSSDYPNLVYLGKDSASYYASYEMESDNGWNELIHLTDTLSNKTSAIEKILDVDRALWMLAFDNALVNLDSYIGGFAQNYYLYRSKNDQFYPIVWDLNESFGRFSMTGTSTLSSTTAKQQMTHLLHENDANYPLIQKLLSVPMYKKMYLAHYKTLLTENFSNSTYFTTAQNLQNLINASVQADNNKFFTNANFTTNLTSDITSGGGPSASSTPGIKSLMNARSTYLLALTDFTQTAPTITEVKASNETPYLNSTIAITTKVQNGTSIYIGYRYDKDDAFTRIQMYDDGNHNDSKANDGVYGVNITMSDLFVQYYIYAENSVAGKFSPERAQHEFYTINVVAPPSGDLVINEFQASNKTTVVDQDNEYDDWIELYNNSTIDIELEGYYLSDNSTNLMKWKFPKGSEIKANSYFIVWADEDTTQVGYHATFKISATKETLFLVDPLGNIVDQISFTNQVADSTFGRFENGSGDFRILPATYNSENKLLLTAFDQVESEVDNFTVYPNPTVDIVNLSENVTWELVNPLGESILKGDSNSIDLSPYAQGIYMIRVEGKTYKVVKK